MKSWPISSGTLAVLGFIAVFVVGWFAYRTMIPPQWLHDFGNEISYRAEPDPNAPQPEDTRQATPRGLAPTPYICVANIIHTPWDRFVVVTEAEDLKNHPLLSTVKWPDRTIESFAEELAKDPRYQLIVLIKDGSVIDAQFFYTFWAELDAVAGPDGYSRDDAVFTAVVKDGTYVLSPATDVPANACAVPAEH